MTESTQLHRELWTSTASSTSQNIKGLSGNAAKSGKALKLIYAEVPPVPKDYVEIDTLIANHEKDETRRTSLEEARKLIAETLYSDKPVSLSVLRLKKGWSQARLAQEMNTSQSHVARIELGHEDLRLSTIKKIAAALNVDLPLVLSAIDINNS